MRVTVVGDFRQSQPILLNTKEATGLLIETDDGQPAVIFRMLPDGKGYIRLCKGEDPNFDEQARQLGLA